MPRRFLSPRSIEERQESFIVKDANVQQLAYLYFEDEPQRQTSMKRLSRDEAFLIAVNIAKLPSVPRQILKDIPRPPNSASRSVRKPMVDRKGELQAETPLPAVTANTLARCLGVSRRLRPHKGGRP